MLDPLLHNTVSPTVLRRDDKFNVIPSEVAALLDGRLLPGFAPDDLLGELRALLGDDVELEVVRYDPGPARARHVAVRDAGRHPGARRPRQHARRRC